MFKVCKKLCNECLFSDNKIVNDNRKQEIINGCLEADTHFICHKQQVRGEKIEDGEGVCCKGFYDKYPTQMIRIARRINAVEFVDND